MYQPEGQWGLKETPLLSDFFDLLGKNSHFDPLRSPEKIYFFLFPELQTWIWAFAARTLVLQRKKLAERHMHIYPWVSLNQKQWLNLGPIILLVRVSISQVETWQNVRLPRLLQRQTLSWECPGHRRDLNDKSWNQVAILNPSCLLTSPPPPHLQSM